MRTLLTMVLAAVSVLAQVGPEELAAEMKIAQESRFRGDFAAAAESLEKVLALATGVYGERSEEVAAVHSDRAAVQRALLRPDAAVEILSTAVNIRARGRGDPAAQARDLTSLAVLYAEAGRVEEARPCLQQALEQWRIAGRDGLETLMAVETLANIHRENAEYGEAEPLYVRALRVREFAYGTESSELLAAIDSLAYVYFGLKQYSAAEALYNRLLKIWEKSAGPEHPMFALTLEKMAEFLAAQQRYEEASPLVDKAITIRGRSHIASMHLRTRLALMRASTEEAAVMVRSTIATAETAGLTDDTFVEPMRVQAAILRDAGQISKALVYEARVRAVIFKGPARTLPPKSPPRQGAKQR